MAKITHTITMLAPTDPKERSIWLNSMGRYVNKTNANEWNNHVPLSLFCLNVNAWYKGNGFYEVEHIFEKKDKPFEVFYSELDTLKHMNGMGGIEYDMPLE